LGLGAILALYRRAGQAGSALRMCNANEQLKGVFTVCQLNLLIPLYDSVKAATKAK
jgi:anti-anti-sigma regulatory factor